MIARSHCMRLLTLVVIVATGAAVWAPAALADGSTTYVVQLAEPGLASYTGGVEGIPATSPKATNRALDIESPAAKKYRAHLEELQQSALQSLAGPRPQVLYSYRTALAGFAAQLTDQQVLELKKSPDVALVQKDRMLHKMDDPNPPVDPLGPTAVDFKLGGFHGDGASYFNLAGVTDDGRLPAGEQGLWQRLGGVGHAGEGIIVGVIDTGITPEHPSFWDNSDLDHRNYRGEPFDAPAIWNGACQAGENFKVTDCNNKLIGARYFVDGFGINNLDPKATVGPRDDEGHGSHTAATAAGDFGVKPSIGGNDLGVRMVSGMAPRAKVASYKVCWEGRNDQGGCTDSDITAGIDAAVADGVDVINFSVGGDQSAVIGPMEIAFLGASDAGVAVANSAGNAGPGPGTVGSPTAVPWLVSVGASTLARTFDSTLTMINADGGTQDFRGASVTQGMWDHPVVDGEKVGKDGVDPADAAKCLENTLDPAKVKDNFVLCIRGVNARVQKGLEVKNAGGVGMILYNANDNDDTVTDNHWLPAIHLSHQDGLAVKGMIADGTKAHLSGGYVTPLDRGGKMAAFSSRGPQTAVPDIPKPDVTAPGVNILAAAAPNPAGFSKPGEMFQAISGTSMSGPHVAGILALLKQLNPMLSPAELKSSLMTTANTDVLKEDNKTPADPFDAGSGEINPNKAADPGLVLPLGTYDYLSYLKSQLPQLPIRIAPTQPTDLNLPAISNSHVVGGLQTSRIFRSVDPTPQHWTAEVVGLDGISSELSSYRFNIKPGQSQQIDMSFSVDTPSDDYVFGALVLTNGNRTVRLPISLKTQTMEVGDDFSFDSLMPWGSGTIPMTPGFTGKLTGIAWGLAKADVKAGETVTKTTGLPELSGSDAGTRLYEVDVPEGSQLLAAKLSNVDKGSPATDLDLYMYKKGEKDDLSDAEQVQASATPTSNESVVEAMPKAGKYILAVVGYKTKAPSKFDLNIYNLKRPQGNDLTAAPGLSMKSPISVKSGRKGKLLVSWAGVNEPGEYMGLVTYHNGTDASLGNAKAFSVIHVTRRSAPAVNPGTLPAVPGAPAAPAAPSVPAAGPTVLGPPAPAGHRPSVSFSKGPVKTPVAGGSKANWLRTGVKSVRLDGRTLVIRMSGTKKSVIRAAITRRGHVVTRSSNRLVAQQAGVTATRLALREKLSPGRYTVILIAVENGRKTTHQVTLVVKK